MRKTILVVAAAWLAAQAGCGFTDTPPLPPDWLTQQARSFIVDAAGNAGAIPTQFGLDGAPAADAAGADDAARLQRFGVRLVRYPRGSKCTLTLDAVFPQPDKPADQDSSYRMDGLKAVATQLSARGLGQVWGAMFNVGTGACAPAGDVEKGTTDIGDPDQWIAVIQGVVQRLRARSVGPGYLEFLPDALRTTGYASLPPSNLYLVYYKFRRALDAAYPPDEVTGRRPLKVLGPSFPLSDPAQVADPKVAWKDLLAHFKSQPQDAPDLLSFLGEADDLPGHATLVRTLRLALDGLGLSNVGIADVSLRPSAATWKSVAAALPSDDARSAWLGAFVAALRIRSADTLSMLIADRLGGPSTKDHPAGTDLYLPAGANRALPGLVAQMPFLLAELGGGHRLPVVEVIPTTPVDADVPAAPADAIEIPGDAAASDAGGGTDGVVLPADALAASDPVSLPDTTPPDVPAAGDLPRMATPGTDALALADTSSPDASLGDGVTTDGVTGDGSDPRDDLVMMATRTTNGSVLVILAAPTPARIGQQLDYSIQVQGLPPATTRWTVRRAVIDQGSDDLRFGSEAVYPAENGRLTIVGPIHVPSVQYLEIVAAP